MTESTGHSLQEDDMPQAKEHRSLLRAVIKSIARIPQDANTREAEEMRSLRRSLTESIEDFPQEDGTPENKDPDEHQLPYSNLNNEHRVLAEIERCTNAGQILEILDKEGVLPVQVGRWRRRHGRAKDVGSKSSIIDAFMHEITDAFVTESIEHTPRADNAPVATASRSLLRSLAEKIERIRRQAVRPEANELHSLLQALGDSIEDFPQDDSAPEGGHELRYFDADRERRILKQVERCNNVTQILKIFDQEGISTAKIVGWRRQRVKTGELHVKRQREAKDTSSITTVNDPGSSLVRNPGRPLMMPHEATSGEPLVSASRSISLADYFFVLRRQKWILMSIVGALLALTTVVLFMLTPRYNAEASIMVDGKEPLNIGLREANPTLPLDDETIASEIEVLLGRSLAAKIVDRLKLERDPELNAELQSKTEFAAVIEQLQQTVTEMFSSPDEEPESDAQRQARTRAAVIDTFLAQLSVAAKERSRVITVAFASTGAEKASNIANTVANQYIDERVAYKLGAARQTTKWLDERIAALRIQVEAAETAVEKYRREAGLIQGRDGTLVAQEISELNTQLVEARAERAAAQARLRDQRRGLTGGSADSISEVLGSALIQRLREQEAELVRKSAELSEDLGGKHPSMLRLQAERRDLQTKIDVEIGKVSRGLQHEADIASAREYAFQARLKELEKQVAKSNASDVQLRSLQADAEANKVLLQTFLTRTKESNSQEYLGALQADAHVISYADVPIKPTYPRKKMILALAFVVSLFIAFAVIYVIEELDPGFRSSEQIERATGLPALGSIPKFSGFGSIGKKLESHILKQPRSAITESFHALYTSIRFSAVGVRPRTILIASSLPLEGKSTIALCLARLWALTGQQVLIVDADLRTPKIHSTLGIKREPGLIEILDDEVSVDDAIRIDEASGACVICAGRPVTKPNYYINSERLDVLLNQLANKFDLVILDSPPVMAVADSRVLATKVDTTVYVAKWASTRREIVKYGIKMIASAGGRISGVVLSMVDSKIHAASRFPDAAAYHTSLNKYYMKLPKQTQLS